MKTITIPERSLVMAFGASGSGKSTFLTTHFEGVVSSDVCRQMVSDQMEDQRYNKQAFEVYHTWLDARLSVGRTTVADATHLTKKAREQILQLAKKHKVPVIVLAFDADLDRCLTQNDKRHRRVPPHVIQNHHNTYQSVLPTLAAEGFSTVIRIDPTEQYTVRISGGVQEIWAPGFDIIGDVHGCADELRELVQLLGYQVELLPHTNSREAFRIIHPHGRQLVFVGDFTDRGPKNVEVLEWLRVAIASGHHAVLGNHDSKLFRALKGNKVKVGKALAKTLAEIDKVYDEEQKLEIQQLLANLPHQLILRTADHYPAVVVTHAGIPLSMMGQDHSAVRAHCLYGESTGQMDENNYPIRGDTYLETWESTEIAAPVLVHGHTVTPQAFHFTTPNVIRIDQGAVFGGQLTALRVPEFVTYFVQAHCVYFDDGRGQAA